MHATRILAELHEMDDIVSSSRQAPRGLLRVNAPLGFGRTEIVKIHGALSSNDGDIVLGWALYSPGRGINQWLPNLCYDLAQPLP